MVDILAVFATGLDYKWVSKVENFYAPFIGWTMVLNGYIPLKRGHLPSILRMFRRCEAALARGDSVFVFPEGTRSPDGNLQSFFRGAFVLSTRNKAPIVPVVIDGTAEILGKGSARIAPRPVLVRVLPPIDPASVDHDDRRLRGSSTRRWWRSCRGCAGPARRRGRPRRRPGVPRPLGLDRRWHLFGLENANHAHAHNSGTLHA